jgi:nitrate/nitrite-specific signal transduction histidine kinase
MDTDSKNTTGHAHRHRQRYFVATEIQLTIAILVVIALMGGLFLQSVTSALTSYVGLKTPVLGVFLILGYVLIVVLLAIFFSHRLVGPFKRLEYEMKHIRAGGLDRRLTIRVKDDLHVRNFTKYTNDFLGSFAEMSREYSKLNSVISEKMGEYIEELSKEDCDIKKIREELESLYLEIHKFREKW